jgi:hypothetical protein
MTGPSASRRSPQQRPDYAGKIDHGFDKMSAKDLNYRAKSAEGKLRHPFQGHPGGFMNWGQFVRFTAIGIGVTLTVVAEIYLAVGATLLDL